MRLKNKTALITGSAHGIGKAMASLFVLEGAKVIISDIDEKDGSSLAESLKMPFLYLDVTNEGDWKKAEKWILDQSITLDIMVNNAGITGFESTSSPMNPEECSLEDWRRVHRVNVDGVFFGCKFAIRLMKNKGGSIINMSSRSGIVGIPSAAPYASSKAAVRNHTKSVALYCAEKRYPIRCNSLHPAAILTPMWDLMLGEGETRKRAMEHITSSIPLRKFGTPEDVANAALYLASEESSYMTGSELHIDGGILAGAGAPPHKE
ncbi:MAG: glucose 1-dehydrogenase [Chlamydiales bacterium]